MVFKKRFIFVLFLFVNLVACSKKVVPPQANLQIDTPPTNSKIVTNIHFVFGTVKHSDSEVLSIETDDLSVLSFEVEDSSITNIDTHQLNDTVKVYYRETTNLDGSVDHDLIRLEVIAKDTEVVNQSVNGVVVNLTLDSITLQVSKDHTITIDLKQFDINELPKLYVGDIIKTTFSGAIDLNTVTTIIPTKIEVLKSSTIQV